MKDSSAEKILKVLANRRRIAILRLLLKRKEMSVTAIAEEIKLSVKSTSRHLQDLYAEDIVSRDQRSLTVYYRMNEDLPKLAQAVISTW
jgi:ArsR family transcriptional regulator, virulence genes transcriptional regulator